METVITGVVMIIRTYIDMLEMIQTKNNLLLVYIQPFQEFIFSGSNYTLHQHIPEFDSLFVLLLAATVRNSL